LDNKQQQVILGKYRHGWAVANSWDDTPFLEKVAVDASARLDAFVGDIEKVI
jgi:hypothetical protein